MNEDGRRVCGPHPVPGFDDQLAVLMRLLDAMPERCEVLTRLHALYYAQRDLDALRERMRKELESGEAGDPE